MNSGISQMNEELEKESQTIEETILSTIAGDENEERSEEQGVSGEQVGESGAEEQRQVSGDADEKTEGEKNELREAARRLNAARKRKKRTVEAGELDAKNAAQPKTETPADQTQDSTQTQPTAQTAPDAANIQPPQSWSIQHKEWFNKQPAQAKQEMAKRWGEMEGYFTKVTQELSQSRQKTAQVEQILNHYMPKWNLNGFTPERVMAELCATQDLIANDPLAGCATVLERTGVTPEQLIEWRDSGGQRAYGPAPQNPQYAPHMQYSGQPQQNLLTKENLPEILKEIRQQELQAAEMQKAEQEFNAVKNEMNAEGRYMYPELHDVNQVQRIQPLVREVRKTQPGISWADAFRRGITILRQLNGQVPQNGSPSPNGTRLTPEEQQKLMQASGSIQGQGNPGIPTQGSGPVGETVEDTIRRTFQGIQT